MRRPVSLKKNGLRTLHGEASSKRTERESQFAALLSHEMRSPLNGILGTSELLMETTLSDLQREYVQTIHASGEVLLGVIDDIFEFSNISASRVALTMAPIELIPLLQSVVANFSAAALEKSIGISLSVHPNVPRIVTGDARRLRQILVHIIGNAVKFTTDGFVAITVTAERRPAGAVTFEIADTGAGVPDAMKETIFEAFAQADMSTTRRFGGTGLGLAIARELLRLMKGTIALRDAPGGGSVFSFTIPFEALNLELPVVTGKSRPERVLLVEDNAINQRVATRLLQRLGLQPDVVVNGHEALAALAGTRYDLVLMDLQMPVMDGLEASAEIRRREASTGAHVPIVAITANALPEDRTACIAAGMDDHVAKPISLANVRRIIARWLPERADTR
jgi:two-component system, sensor histidine kinase